MPYPKNDKPRVLGPYRDGRYFRIEIVDPAADGRPVRRFESEAQAQEYKAAVEANWHRLNATTVEHALERYDEHLRTKGNKKGPVKDGSRVETLRRLRAFFRDATIQVASLTEDRCARYYATLCETPTKYRRAPSVDTHRNYLAEAKTFGRWLVREKLLGRNPLEGIEGVGARRPGEKPQLMTDESRLWLREALRRAEAGDDAALIATCALVFGCRASEITNRVVRDLDADGTIFRISKAKTKKGNRGVEVPELLRSHLLRLARGRAPGAPLFPLVDREGNERHRKRDVVRYQTRKICQAVGVPLVCAHGLRGSHATLAEAAGVSSQVIAATLGHESDAITHRAYTDPSAVQTGRAKRALAILTGGKK